MEMFKKLQLQLLKLEKKLNKQEMYLYGVISGVYSSYYTFFKKSMEFDDSQSPEDLVDEYLTLEDYREIWNNSLHENQLDARDFDDVLELLK